MRKNVWDEDNAYAMNEWVHVLLLSLPMILFVLAYIPFCFSICNHMRINENRAGGLDKSFKQLVIPDIDSDDDEDYYDDGVKEDERRSKIDPIEFI